MYHVTDWVTVSKRIKVSFVFFEVELLFMHIFRFFT